MSDLPKDRKSLFTLAELAGWSVKLTNGGHFKLTNPVNGKCVIAANTPSDHRSDLNFRAELRRAGLSRELIERADDEDTKQPDTTEYFTMPATTQNGKERVQIFPVIREVLSKYTKPLTPDEFWPQVSAKLPKDYPKELFMRALTNGKSRGVLIEVSGGYRVTASKRHPAPSAAEPTLPTNEDQLVLLDALKALEALRALIEKYQKVDMTHEGMLAKARAEMLEKLK